MRLPSRLAPLLLLAACAGGGPDPDLLGQPAPAPARRYLVPTRLADDSRITPSVVWDERAGRPRMIAGAFPVAAAASDEAAARAVLRRHAGLLALAADGSDLTLTATRTGLAGTYLRFGQLAKGLPVLDREVVVLVAPDRREVRAINLGHVPGIAATSGDDLGVAAALASARAHVGHPVETEPVTTVRGVRAGDTPRVAYRITLPTAAATWQVDVDAATGKVLAAHDRNRRADGTGLVFDMSPIASTNVTTLADGNDATSAALDAARYPVTLPRLDGTGVLRGPWVDARPLTEANRARDAGLAFAYDRADDRFEEVMIYFHLDRAQARIQALGFTSVNNRVQVALANAISQDNSFYSPSNKQLRFGTGGVDDAEDADIILHEYGHSIQDNQVPGWGSAGSDADAMGEGFGDYLAASFSQVLPPADGRPQPADPACVGDWDAISYDSGTPPCLRRVDTTKHHPEAAVGQVHTDGELWSSALWRARAAVGADVMDRLVLEAHFLMTVDESFDGAANAVLMADQMVFGGAHVPAVRRALYVNGVLRTPLAGAAYADAMPEAIDVRNPVGAGGQYANRLDDTQVITRPGASALRLHFASLATQSGGNCLDGGCDNVYLYDGNVDLYQILNGSRTDLLSVQVPGDTVRVRLVTDASTTAAGYRIDRVDVMSGAMAIDAAQPIDARPPVDAAPTPIDAAPTPVDAAPTPIDAADPVDAGELVDAPGGAADGDDTGGCGCRTGGDAGAPLLGLAVLALVARRRRARA